MKKLKCKVVMLPTEKSMLVKPNKLSNLDGSGQLFIPHFEYKSVRGYTSDLILTAQHLYLVSDREIKKGDWFIVQLYDITSTPMKLSLEQVKTITDEIWVNQSSIVTCRHIENCSRVEATTDPSLNLPLIPQSFIEEYVSKQGKIEEVYIEIGKLQYGIMRTPKKCTKIISGKGEGLPWNKQNIHYIFRYDYGKKLL
jgi:hypothetical protein